jgi:hypothetical protein
MSNLSVLSVFVKTTDGKIYARKPDSTERELGDGTGEANTASNVGTGTGIFKQKTGVDLEFYKIKAAGGLTVSLVSNDVTIDASSLSLGEVNTASNLGTGDGEVFKQKVSSDLQFRTLSAGAGIAITTNADEVEITATGGGAPTNASYVVLGADGTLTDERVLTAGANISVTDAGAGSTVTIAFTGVLPLANGGTGISSLVGEAGKVLTVNGTETGYEFTSPGGGGSPAGADTQVQYNDGGAFGAEAAFAYDKTNNWLTVLGGATLGASPPAAGVLRIGTGATADVIKICVATAEQKFLYVDGSGNEEIGDPDLDTTIHGAALTLAASVGQWTATADTSQKHMFYSGGANRFALQDNKINCIQPLAGYQPDSAPLSYYQTNVAISGNTTLTATQYEHSSIRLTGSMGDATFELVLPDWSGAGFWILNEAGGAALIRRSPGGSTDCTVAKNTLRFVHHIGGLYWAND